MESQIERLGAGFAIRDMVRAFVIALSLQPGDGQLLSRARQTREFCLLRRTGAGSIRGTVPAFAQSPPFCGRLKEEPFLRVNKVRFRSGNPLGALREPRIQGRVRSTQTRPL